MALSEADTCRKFVVPKLQEAGWDNEPHSIAEQRSITDGRIMPVGNLNGSKLSQLRVPLPSLMEQRRIAAELDALLPAILDRVFHGEL